MKVFVGYDIREDIAFQVCEYSIHKHQPVAQVIALKQAELRESGVYTRAVDPLSSTEFTFTRFLVPYLADYKGWALFVDCDFVFTADVAELFAKADDRYAVMVVKHDYTPKEGLKMDGCKQLPYPRKNWSSAILWNCAHPANKQMTPDTMNTQTGQYLHRFQWLDDTEIHYTEGGPWFAEYRRCDYHKIWKQYLKEMLK